MSLTRRAWRSCTGFVLCASVSMLLISVAWAAPPKRAQLDMDPKDAGYFLPASAFDVATGQRTDLTGAAGLPARAIGTGPAASGLFERQVYLYLSPSTEDFFKRGGVRYDLNGTLWERFLAKYGFPFKSVKDPRQLESAQGGVLILPSSVALTADERRIISDFAARGGSIIATWMTGTRDPAGSWQGFNFMESLLGVQVRGTSGNVEDERYINPYGDIPVSHSVPAGSRIWTELLPAWAPLRIHAAHGAASMMTWAHKATRAADEGAEIMAFDDSGRSRMVYLGWPERTWMGADAKYHEGLLYDSVNWALRMPSVSVGPWPYPYRGAYVPTVYMADVFNANDMPFANLLRTRGLHASYFILGYEIDKSAETLKQLSAMGNEISYEGDVYETFADQPLAQQTERLQAMRTAIAAANVPVSANPGFNPPMDGSDAVTRIAVAQQPFRYMVSWVDAVDGCMPQAFNAPGAARAEPLILMPRLLRGVEEMLEDYDEDESVATHRADLARMARMGCFAAARYANQSLLSPTAQAASLDAYVENRNQLWAATGSQVADWWLARSRVHAELSGEPSHPILNVTVVDRPVTQDMVLWVNLPVRGRLPVLSGPSAPQTVLSTDGMRAAIPVRNLPTGQYRWTIQF